MYDYQNPFFSASHVFFRSFFLSFRVAHFMNIQNGLALYRFEPSRCGPYERDCYENCNVVFTIGFVTGVVPPKCIYVRYVISNYRLSAENV